MNLKKAGSLNINFAYKITAIHPSDDGVYIDAVYCEFENTFFINDSKRNLFNNLKEGCYIFKDVESNGDLKVMDYAEINDHYIIC